MFILSAANVNAGKTGIDGVVRYDGEAVAGAYLEAFSGFPDDAARPVATATSGDGGVFLLPLSPGEYYLTARKRPNGGGAAGMLYGTSGSDPLPVAAGRATSVTIHLSDRGQTGGLVSEGADVMGRVVYQGRPMGGAYVYFYPGSIARGPNYLARVRTGEDGVFKTRLLPGPWSVKVRFAEGGDGMGTVQRNDKVGEYPGNPLQVASKAADLGTVVLRDVDQGAWEKLHWAASE